ncbi:MAG: hypothetical protein RLO38_09520 [Roseovarius confluentis]|uniref:hypothetical protein n=1 Tax=Roseovarius sp. TaxID=1486281 RepID=UPI0032EB5FD9
MARPILMTAVPTGAFRSLFAVVVDIVMNLFSLWQRMLASAAAGSRGSLFAQAVVGRPKDKIRTLGE